ncbi:MAG: DNA mismatch repair endonuclease MutL [Paracoccaceae bacterium]|nr:DNA mismatch repair endonuclease MutL [Paracoccaceae bacterium]
MNAANPNITTKQPQIRQLDEAAVNRIAAGEVVERPASVVKELVENAIDAGATRIDVSYAAGGKNLIRVVDDGHGITADELPLALSRHATSKIDGSDLLNIHTFGFRGEALPSLGAVGRLSLVSRAIGSDSAFEISVNGSIQSPVKPAALTKGTIVTLADLFYATPARLKFMRTDRSEAQAISDVIKRLAMAEPHVGFTLRDVSEGGQGRVVLRLDAEQGDFFDALHSRLKRLLGADFAANALRIEAEREGHTLTGYAALPTYSRGTSVAQFLFVNGRPVKDRLLIGALRGAYADFLSRDRHPAVVLNISCDPARVDVNVHPAKSEVRFRDPGLARGLIVSGLKHALAVAGHRASTTVADATLGAFNQEPVQGRVYQMDRPSSGAIGCSFAMQSPDSSFGFAEANPDFNATSARVEMAEAAPELLDRPLGAARAQVHENYIVAQTRDGMILVDQHAAHERLVYEKLKNQMVENGVAAQALLIPEIIELSVGDRDLILEMAGDLAALGLEMEPFGGTAIAIRATPAVLGEVNAAAMIHDVLDELSDQGESRSLRERIEAVLSRIACHGSIRSGRRMQADEMNALLREMEATPHSGQCNHGRPTYVELKLADIERLFGRT